MYKSLYRTALITSPIFGIYSIAQFFFTREDSLQMFLLGSCITTTFTFIQWLINIFLLKITEHVATYKRYILSYLGSASLIIFSFIIVEFFLEDVPRGNPAYPFMMIMSVNTFILIFVNSELLRRRKETAEMELQELKIKNMEAQHHLLMRQFQPHFLFNALSTLKSLMRIDLKEADSYLLKLSEFLRFSITYKDKSLVPLEKELHFAKEYLRMQQVRFENAIFCEFNISEDLNQWKIPVFAVQSLVENAIKHNGFSEEEPLYINIDTQDQSLAIFNNRIFKKITNSNQSGLLSLNDRHKLLTGEFIKIKETDEQYGVILKLVRP